ncbi:COP9 signalosome complex subunit 8 isoform X1 [Pleuronectes platessa]|uniref:COP9 signalosome complex subunit 8 isoform X1 n=1 Tax=Pleuronectes platessa TaxID=8262 RepID=UPI00232A7879|nr:COP9 signalosome complex subunit 8 isoform X1 [Pleuronectes platessa]
MPTAVIMEESYDKVLEQCEAQEVEAPGGIATPQVYAQLLSLYLLHNDMNNARYLWKRVPQAIKLANPELAAIWAVGQRIWQRDFPEIYTAIAAFQWTENILPVMEALRESTRQRAYSLVAQAYTSITAEDFAACVGYTVEEAVKGVVSQGWQADPTTRMVMPKKPGRWRCCSVELCPSRFCCPNGFIFMRNPAQFIKTRGFKSLFQSHRKRCSFSEKLRNSSFRFRLNLPRTMSIFSHFSSPAFLYFF